MSRDYKQASDRPSKNKKGSSFFPGLLFGVIVGVGASLAVVMYLNRDDSPFKMQNSKEVSTSLADKIATDGQLQPAPAEITPPATNNPPAETTENKDDTRFDYYEILPNGEKANADALKADAEVKPANNKTYYLQIGSFQAEEDADNLKAKLALQGFEATVQTADIAGKGIWHRVRVGPFNDLDQISKSKEDLISNGFSADLIKVNNS